MHVSHVTSIMVGPVNRRRHRQDLVGRGKLSGSVGVLRPRPLPCGVARDPSCELAWRGCRDPCRPCLQMSRALAASGRQRLVFCLSVSAGCFACISQDLWEHSADASPRRLVVMCSPLSEPLSIGDVGGGAERSNSALARALAPWLRLHALLREIPRRRAALRALPAAEGVDLGFASPPLLSPKPVPSGSLPPRGCPCPTRAGIRVGSSCSSLAQLAILEFAPGIHDLVDTGHLLWCGARCSLLESCRACQASRRLVTLHAFTPQ